MSSYEDAIIFALHKHGDQTRWNGDPYIVHPLRVAARAEEIANSYGGFYGPISVDAIKKAAVLHDVIEDTDESCKGIMAEEIQRRFGERVSSLVVQVSRPAGETYRDYIDGMLKRSETAALVIKRADLLDNLSDLPEDHGLQKRYQPALKKITERLDDLLGD